CPSISPFSSFSYNATATPVLYTLSLHDALPISVQPAGSQQPQGPAGEGGGAGRRPPLCAVRHLGAEERAASCRRAAVHEPLSRADRKSTRLNSSHLVISYAVFCLKKKIKNTISI